MSKISLAALVSKSSVGGSDHVLRMGVAGTLGGGAAVNGGGLVGASRSSLLAT